MFQFSSKIKVCSVADLGGGGRGGHDTYFENARASGTLKWAPDPWFTD